MPVSESLEWLRSASHEWLAGLTIAAQFLSGAGFLALVGVAMAGFLGGLPPIGGEDELLVGVVVLGLLAASGGIYFLTRREPHVERIAEGLSARRLTRWLACGAAPLLLFGSVGVALTGWTWAGLVVSLGVACLLWGLLPICLTLYLEELARGIPAATLARQCRWARWVCICAAIVGLLYWLAETLVRYGPASFEAAYDSVVAANWIRLASFFVAISTIVFMLSRLADALNDLRAHRA